MNPLLIFGAIFLLITLIVKPKLTKKVPENACHQAHEAVEDNKRWYKIFLILSVTMIVAGIILIII